MQESQLQSRIKTYIQSKNWFANCENPIPHLVAARDVAENISKDLKQELLSCFNYEHDHYNYVILIESRLIDGSCAASYISPGLSQNDFYIQHKLSHDGFEFIFHVWGIKLV